MARHTTVTIPERTWVQLTDSNVTSITFQNVSLNTSVYITATAGTTAPAAGTAAFLVYAPSQGELNTSLSDLFPGLSAFRVWAYNPPAGEGDAKVFVSHA